MSLSDRLEAARARRGEAARPAALRPAPAEPAAAETVEPAPRLVAVERPPRPATPITIAPDGSSISLPVVRGLQAESTEEATPDDGLDALRIQASDELAERMGNRLTDTSLDEVQLLTLARRELAGIIAERAGHLPEETQLALIDDVADDALGLGPLQKLLDDATVSEIMVNGAGHIYVERAGRIQRTRAVFRSEERLRRVIERIVSRVGRRNQQ
jgi:pilus assembly protein CpaF